MAAKQIIILETHPGEGGETRIQTAMWFPVPPGQEKPIPNLAASVWTGASADEIEALKTGKVVEEVRDLTFPGSYPPNDVKVALETVYRDRLNYRNSIPSPMQFYGVYYDGAWSM